MKNRNPRVKNKRCGKKARHNKRAKHSTKDTNKKSKQEAIEETARRRGKTNKKHCFVREERWRVEASSCDTPTAVVAAEVELLWW